MKQVHAQDAITVVQKNSGKHDVANFDPVSQKTVRDALLVLGTTILRFARVEKLGKAGRAIHAIECDVPDQPKVAEMATWVGKSLGQVDIRIHCAGIGGVVHLRGTFLVTRQFFEPMVSRCYGRIIDFPTRLQRRLPALRRQASSVSHARFPTKAHRTGVMVNARAPGPV